MAVFDTERNKTNEKGINDRLMLGYMEINAEYNVNVR